MPEWHEKVDERAKTFKQEPEAPDRLNAPKVSTDHSATITTPNVPNTVGNQQQATKGQTLKLLGTLVVGTALGVGGAGYFFLQKNQQETQADTQTAPSAPPSASSHNEMQQEQDMPKTPQDLLRQMKKFNVKVNATDLPKNYRNMVNLLLIEEKEPDGSSKPNGGYHWQVLDNRKILESKRLDQAILIATKLERPEYRALVEYLGVKPTIAANDETDPTILYQLYLCSTNKNPVARGAAIVVKQPNNRRKYLTTLDMNIPLCEEEKKQ